MHQAGEALEGAEVGVEDATPPGARVDTRVGETEARRVSAHRRVDDVAVTIRLLEVGYELRR